MNLEGGKWWYGHVVELPGCFTRGASREEVLVALPDTVEMRLRWLISRGIPCRRLEGFEVVEEQGGIPELGESGGAVALFESDLVRVDRNALNETAHLMALSREELLARVIPLGKDLLNAELIHGKRTVQQDISHIVNAEEWYVSRLGRRYQRVYEEGLRGEVGRLRLSAVERLSLTRPHMVVALETALAEDRQGPFARKAYTRYPEELWTLRKVLRRFLEHEREHFGTIERTLNALRNA